MKIAFDARKINREIRTGIEEYSYHLLKNLLEIDSKNTYILYFDRPPSDKVKGELNLNQATCVVVPFPRSPVPWVTFALPLRMGLSNVRSNLLFMPVHYIPPLSPSKVIFTAYDAVFDHFGALTRWTHRVLLRLAINRAQHILAISCATQQDLIKHLGTDSHKITVTPLGYDNKVFHEFYTAIERQDVLAKYGLNGDYILYCGTLQPRKNVSRLIEAYSLLEKHHEIPQRLVIVGKQGWGFQQVYRRVQELGVIDRVVFTGYVPSRDLAMLMTSASLFAFPSLYEGFGIPLLEAMACGVPVVTSNISSMPEVVGDAAVLVNPYNVQELADGMRQILGNTGLAQSMKEKGMARAKLFSWRKTADLTLQVFEKLGD